MTPYAEEFIKKADRLIGSGLIDEAADMLMDLVRDEPSAVPAWHLLFTLARTQDRMQTVVDLALAGMPSVEDPQRIFLVVAQHMKTYGYIDEAVAVFEAILRHQPDAQRAADEMLRHFGTTEPDDAVAFAEYRRWNERYVRPLMASVEPARTDPDPDRPLRIGYLSSDFATPFNHSVIWYLVPWFAATEGPSDSHIIYSTHGSGTVRDDYFLNATEKVVDVFDLDDAALNERIRADKIDILVDLAGYMPGNRMAALTKRPAPIIVAWAALDATSASEAVDYLIADDFVLPHETLEHYIAKVAYLPGPMLAWYPPPEVPDVGPPPHRRNGHISFGNLNRVMKINRQSIALWAEVLRAIPDATMTFKDFRIDEAASARLARQFGEQGVAGDRLILLGETDHYNHLAAYNEIDISLDSFPMQGSISSFEGLWMGVPMVTYYTDKRPPARSGAFIVNGIGLSELATTDRGEFVEIATRLAGDGDRLSELRSGLRETVRRSPLCDDGAFAGRVKRAFRGMWRRHCAGEPPAHFAVAEFD